MKTGWRWPDPCEGFPWTPASRGARDGRDNRPSERDFVIVPATLAKNGTPPFIMKGPVAGPNGHPASFDEVIELDAWLKTIGVVMVPPHVKTLIDVAEADIDRLEERHWRRKPKVQSKVLRAMDRLGHVLEKDKKVWDLHMKKDFTKPDLVIAGYVYLPAMAAMGIAEFAFNVMAFEGLNAGDLETILIACGLGVMTPLVAHSVGTVLRQWPKNWAEGLRKWPTVLIMASLTSGALMAFLGVAWLRADFLQQQVSTLGLAVSTTNDWLSQLSLFAINLFIFASSVGLAFFSHDQDRVRERISRELNRLKRKAAKCWKQWSRPATKFNREVAVASKRAEFKKDNCLAGIDEYVDHNIRNRTDAAPSWMRIGVTRTVFREREFGRLLEREPAPLNEILEGIQGGKPVMWVFDEHANGNGIEHSNAHIVTSGGDGHAPD